MKWMVMRRFGCRARLSVSVVLFEEERSGGFELHRARLLRDAERPFCENARGFRAGFGKRDDVRVADSATAPLPVITM
jgi:hypothetical protein